MRRRTKKRPRGTWVGIGGWHPTVLVVAPQTSIYPEPGTAVEVDTELAPLLLELWRLGLPTTASCQNAPVPNADEDESGEAHINFETQDAATRFVTVVGSGAFTYRPPISRFWRKATSVAFPTSKIQSVTTSVVEWARASAEFDEFAARVEAEPDPAKKRRIYVDRQAELVRQLAEIEVEIVERVRVRCGDEAAAQTLSTLRSVRNR